MRPCSYVNPVPMSTLFLCQPCSYVNPVPMSTLFLCQPCSYVNPVPMSTLFLCQPCSYVNPVPMSTLFLCQPCSYVNPVPMSTLFLYQPQLVSSMPMRSGIDADTGSCPSIHTSPFIWNEFFCVHLFVSFFIEDVRWCEGLLIPRVSNGLFKKEMYPTYVKSC